MPWLKPSPILKKLSPKAQENARMRFHSQFTIRRESSKVTARQPCQNWKRRKIQAQQNGFSTCKRIPSLVLARRRGTVPKKRCEDSVGNIISPYFTDIWQGAFLHTGLEFETDRHLVSALMSHVASDFQNPAQKPESSCAHHGKRLEYARITGSKRGRTPK